MSTYRFRAARMDGTIASGRVEASDRPDALAQLRSRGSAPLELVEVRAAARPPRAKAPSARRRAAAAAIIAELAVLLKAGLQLDRAMALAIQNIADAETTAAMAGLLTAVRAGVPLSRAMAAEPALFSPTAVAMTEAGEANGRLGESLDRLAAMLEQAAELRRLIGASMIYPAALLTIAVGVILLMLLFVVPQFESLFATSTVELPTASRFVMHASRLVRDYGLWFAGGTVGVGAGVRVALRRPAARRSLDRAMLATPQVGELIRRVETARFAHTMGALLEGSVPLPDALALAQRTIGNRVIAHAVGDVAARVREGGGLTAPLAAANVLPRLAIGFLRTGEETSQLGMMMTRLAEVLDRDIRLRLQRLIGILTPAITVALGTTVAAIVASIMSAILGFNDLAVTQ